MAKWKLIELDEVEGDFTKKGLEKLNVCKQIILLADAGTSGSGDRYLELLCKTGE